MMHLSEEQIQFNKLMSHMHAPSTIRLKMNIDSLKYKELLKVYVEYEEYSRKKQDAILTTNKALLDSLWTEIEALAVLIQKSTLSDQRLYYEQKLDSLAQEYAQIDISQPYTYENSN